MEAECLSIMKEKAITRKDLSDLIKLIQEITERCQKRFADPRSGKGPSCLLSLRMETMSCLIGYYLPILHHFGWNEYDHLVYGDGIFSLPFSHADVWRYLTGKERKEVPSDRVLAEHGVWKAVVGGIRAGQVFFIRDLAEYRKLGLEDKVKGGSLDRGSGFVASRMKRLWNEFPLPHVENGCAFCAGDIQNPIKRGDFIIFDNRFKPHPWHKVVIPSKELLKRLPPDPVTGLLHPKMLSGMLRLLPELCEERRDRNCRVSCGLHLGVFGGQTLAHPHLHARQ